MQIKALIVDDEPAQHELLTGMLAHHPDVTIVRVCTSADEALSVIARDVPDLIFLDVIMPGKTGFDFLSELPYVSFGIIFTTSFDSFALKAFQFSAIDYLLKPFSQEQLDSAMRKFTDRHISGVGLAHVRNLIANLGVEGKQQQKIALPTANGFVFVALSDIIRCISQNVYTTFFLRDGSQIVVSRSIKDVERQLAPHLFMRVHQSHIVNLHFMKKYNRGDGGQVVMEDDAIVDVSRNRKDEFLNALKRL